MCFFWITALIDIFMKIIITREYIMKRKVLAIVVPALLMAGAANAAPDASTRHSASAWGHDRGLACLCL